MDKRAAIVLGGVSGVTLGYILARDHIKMNQRTAVLAGVSAGVGLLGVGTYIAMKDYIFPNTTLGGVYHMGGCPSDSSSGSGGVYHMGGCPRERAKSNYTPIPQPLVERIQSTGWSILEVCAGDGQNLTTLQEAGVDVIGFDLRPSEKVKYGLAGCVEAEHSERTLMLACGFEVQKSISAYLKAGGKRVILGGYAIQDNLVQEEVYLLRDMSRPEILVKESRSSKHCSSNHYDGTLRKVEIRPDPDYMKSQGLSLKEAYLGPHPNGSQTGDSMLCYYQVWELDTEEPSPSSFTEEEL